jgi:predicted Rossmann fold nucleotide-binding protein DprA/Smf involved in DNA uptake
MLLGFGRTILHRLVKAFGFPGNVLASRIANLEQVHGVGNKFARAISAFDVDRVTDCEFGLAQKVEICILTLTNEEYLNLLGFIYVFPPVLHVKGKRLDSIFFPLAVV